MQFVDIPRQYAAMKQEIDTRVAAVFSHGRFVLGPEVAELEAALAQYTATPHCISCSSGTDALVMALMANNIGPGDAVITTPFTFVASAEAIALTGARPVFVDIDPRTFLIDTDALRKCLDTYSGAETIKAILPVDLFGQLPSYDEIEKLAADHGIAVIADAAQSFGAVAGGTRACGFGSMAATSFFPAKPLGCFGDGGAVFCHSDEDASLLRSIRVHGMGSNKYENVRIGINGRLDTLQAAILCVKLARLDKELEARRTCAQRFSDALKGYLRTPLVRPRCTSAWAQYSLMHSRRDEVCARLHECGIPTAIYYPVPLHRQPAFSYLGYERDDFPVAEYVAARIFSIPVHPYLEQTEVDEIISALQRVCGEIPDTETRT